MKKTTEKKGPDYTLNVFPSVHPDTKKEGVSFVVQTTKVFVSFQYDVPLEHDLKGRTIRLKIKGLHAPELLMPGGGPAIGSVHIPGLTGHYQLVVVKQDRTESSFDIEVARERVTVLRSPEQSFLLISTEKV